MIRIFILEDNESKLQSIVACLKGHYNEEVRIDSCGTFNVGMNKLLKGDFDIAILDNNMPRYANDFVHIVNDAAEEAMELLWLYEKDTKCIVCSSEPFEAESKHSNCLDVLKYSNMSVDWRNKLIQSLKPYEKRGSI